MPGSQHAPDDLEWVDLSLRHVPRWSIQTGIAWCRTDPGLRTSGAAADLRALQVWEDADPVLMARLLTDTQYNDTIRAVVTRAQIRLAPRHWRDL